MSVVFALLLLLFLQLITLSVCIPVNYRKAVKPGPFIKTFKLTIFMFEKEGKRSALAFIKLKVNVADVWFANIIFIDQTFVRMFFFFSAHCFIIIIQALSIFNVWNTSFAH